METGVMFSTYSISGARTSREIGGEERRVKKRTESQRLIPKMRESPRGLRLKAKGSNSTQCSPGKYTHPTLFPPWLLGRKDFQDLSEQYSNLAAIDVFRVCGCPAHQRNRLEHRAVIDWVLESPFLTGITGEQLDEVCERLTSVQFSAGDVLMEAGGVPDCMYILVEGEVSLKVGSTTLIERIYPKNVIGELGLQSRTPRSATVVALTAVKALKLTAEDYEVAVFKLKLQQSREQSLFLRSTSFFSIWNKGKIERLAGLLMVKSYKKGQLLYKPGEFPQSLFIVRSGFVQLTTLTSLHRSNQWPKSPRRQEVTSVTRVYKRVLRECRPGDVFGESELLESIGRTCTAICIEPSLLYLLTKESLEDVFTERERVRLKELNAARPETSQIRTQLEAEQMQSAYVKNALLDGLSANPLPTSRLFEQQECRRQHLAQLFIQRHRSCERQLLLRQSKDLRVVKRNLRLMKIQSINLDSVR